MKDGQNVCVDCGNLICLQCGSMQASVTSKVSIYSLDAHRQNNDNNNNNNLLLSGYMQFGYMETPHLFHQFTKRNNFCNSLFAFLDYETLPIVSPFK